ncbi:MAG: 2,3-bisphosphoglycerate-independent phosphoglycerate mutase [Candidatus Margulisiibacteriota bacterium]|jgi:2,3-bisphosphoglycerate-independent phosphoglycerate mutase
MTKLTKLFNYQKLDAPVLFIIMDGVGIGKNDETNAVFQAKTPNLDQYFKAGLYTQLKAHGTAVGLPSDEDMGNSEVGHNALGAGQIVEQGAKLINQAFSTGAIFQSETWSALKNQIKSKNSTLHLIGLLSDGNVHSNIVHLFNILKEAAKEGVKKARIHTLLDGRDVAEKSALIYLAQLEEVLATINIQPDFDYKIASGGGRMVTTMDRYFADWSVVKRGWDAHVLGQARNFASAAEAINTYYAEDPKITDQYLPSFVVADQNGPIGTIQDQDVVIFYNFRGDRAIEISMAFENQEFNYFDRVKFPETFYAGMMQYDGDLKIPTNYLVSPPTIENILGRYFCETGITTLAISETQKFGHVTYFWNGNNSGYLCENQETFVEITSDIIPFDQAPLMKAKEITEKTIELLKTGKYQFARLNFPNGDMVGHTGVMEAAILAVETVDHYVGELVEYIKSVNGIVVISADHGNADEMFTYKNGVKIPKTSHTLNPVPFCILDYAGKYEYELANVQNPGLANVAATLCNLLGYQAPKFYEPSLIKLKNLNEMI